MKNMQLSNFVRNSNGTVTSQKESNSSRKQQADATRRRERKKKAHHNYADEFGAKKKIKIMS